MAWSRLLPLSCCVLAAVLGCAKSPGGALSTAELEGIKRADQAYAEAWLANDSERIMSTLTADAVLAPSGLPVLEGATAIREFWWPENSPPTKVTEFKLVQQEVHGQNDLGFVRGSFTLAFEYDGQSYESGGVYFSILRRSDEGSWRISHRIWSDL